MGPWEETKELVEWMREFNVAACKRGDSARVHYCGTDLPRDGDTLSVPLNFLESWFRIVDAEFLESADWLKLRQSVDKASQLMVDTLNALEASGRKRAVDPDVLDFITSVQYELLTEHEERHAIHRLLRLV
jgi:erythromycin esterase-like protein